MGGFDLAGMLYVIVVFVVVFFPLFLRRGGPPPGPHDSDSGGGGWGKGPSQPPTPPKPQGGIPLRDAEPARVRLRGHERLSQLLPPRERRPAPGSPGHRPRVPAR
jgi:hypothetical protein